MITTREVARSINVGPATRKFTLRDELGIAYRGHQAHNVLAALSREDRSEGLSAEVRTVAYAVRKSAVTARMAPEVAWRLCEMTPWQVCALVARVANECPETTTGGICDVWLPVHQRELV
jgi:hypothetical protein